MRHTPYKGTNEELRGEDNTKSTLRTNLNKLNQRTDIDVKLIGTILAIMQGLANKFLTYSTAYLKKFDCCRAPAHAELGISVYINK